MSKATDTYECALCHKMKRGRFTRRRDGAQGSWTPGDSQRRSIPTWYCYICLPQGQGRDEEIDVAKTQDRPQGAAAAVLAPSINIEREHQKGLALVNPILEQIQGLSVTTEEEYQAADGLVGEIRKRRKAWSPIWEAIMSRVVKPQRDALEGVYSINREVDGPLEKAEKQVKTLMTSYKNEERDRIAKEELERELEAERTQQQIEATRVKLAGATGSVKGVLTRNLNRLETHQQAVIETVPMAVQGVNSSSRVVKSVVVENLPHFASALTLGTLKDDPIKPLILNAINSVLRSEGRSQEARDIMAQWPGLKLVESTQIVGH